MVFSEGVSPLLGLSSFAAHDVNIAAVPQIRMAASIHFFKFLIFTFFRLNIILKSSAKLAILISSHYC